VVWDAPGNVQVRSWTLLVLWLWLVSDVWFGLGHIGKLKRWKNVIFTVLAGLSACIMLVSVYWLLNLKLIEQQDDAYSNLAVQMELPSAANVVSGFFTITYKGKTKINFKNTCEVHLIVGNGGRTLLAGVTIWPNPQRGSVDPSAEQYSTQCLIGISQSFGVVDCADVELQITYSLITQPLLLKDKFFRFFGYREGDQLVLVPETPVGQQIGKENDFMYCRKYLKAPIH
jgi:hypothetical protein